MTETTPERASAYKALIKAQTEFAPALKTNTNPAFRSKYVGLDGCVEAVIDALNNNGFYLIQRPSDFPDGITVETSFLHESGVEISGGAVSLPASKKDPQGYGSALTYARRYGLMAACGIAPEDDDGNAATAATVAAARPKTAQPQTTKKEEETKSTSTKPSGPPSAPLDLSTLDVDGLRQELTRLTALAKQNKTTEEQVTQAMQTAMKAGGVKRASDLPLEDFRNLAVSVQALVHQNKAA